MIVCRASAIRETSEKLKGVGPLGDVAGRAADGIDSVAHFFEGKQITDLARDVERFARREPALFLGAAFAVGLIGGRFLKSSGHRDDRGMPSTGYARQGGLGSDRDDASYSASSWGDGGHDAGFVFDDDLDGMDSKRFTSRESQPTWRATLPLGTRTAPAPRASTSPAAPPPSPAASSIGSSSSISSSGDPSSRRADSVPPSTFATTIPKTPMTPPPTASPGPAASKNGNGNGNGNPGRV